MKTIVTTASDRYFRYKDICFDVSALAGIRHTCDPLLCRTQKSCCSTYEISLTKRELTHVGGILHYAADFIPSLCPADECDNVFELEEDGMYTIDTDYNGLCALAFKDTDKTIKCALHAAALKYNIRLTDAKPRCCIMWPLAIAEGPLTIVTVHDDAFQFPCNRRRRAGCQSLHKGIADIIETLFGDEARSAIDQYLANHRQH